MNNKFVELNNFEMNNIGGGAPFLLPGIVLIGIGVNAVYQLGYNNGYNDTALNY